MAEDGALRGEVDDVDAVRIEGAPGGLLEGSGDFRLTVGARRMRVHDAQVDVTLGSRVAAGAGAKEVQHGHLGVGPHRIGHGLL